MRKLIGGAVLCVLFFAALRMAMAQTADGVITGTVFDAVGAVIPGVTVTITNEGTSISQTKRTGSDGGYRFDLVPPGTYSVSAKAPNFGEKIQKGIVVRTSQTVPLNVTLEVASATTVVEVTSSAPLVQTATADQAHTVDNVTIINTVLLTRNVYDLVFIAPQVTQGMNFGPASGGARESGTTFLLNGSDNNDNFSEGSVNVTPPLETVQEFSLLTNTMTAQYGHAAGALLSASQKTGTNNLHGALYEFNRNRSLNASDFFQNRQGSPKPQYVRNQFGGEIDGPIVKNKTFFAAGYDQVTLHTGGDIDLSTPTPAYVTMMSTGAGPIASYYLSKYPPLAPTPTGQNSQGLCPNQAINNPTSVFPVQLMGCAHVHDPIADPQHRYFVRVDHNFSEKDRVNFTANILREHYVDTYGGGYASTKPIPYTDNEHYHNLTLVETHVFGPTLFNELTVAHNRHQSRAIEGDGKIPDPQLAIDGADFNGLGFGFGPYEGGFVVNFTQDRWQLQDNLGWTKGTHSFKFGGGWQYGILYRNWDLGLPGFYEFAKGTGVPPSLAPNGNGGVGVVNSDGTISNINDSLDTNFQNDFPYFQEMSIDPRTGARGNAYRHYIMKDASFFINDDWKVRPRLTLNLGLRWERYGAPTEQHGIVAQLTNFNCLTGGQDFKTCMSNVRIGPAKSMWNTRNKDFAPRVGFAWDIFGNGRTSLRAGYGISYDRIFDNVWSNGAWNPPFYGLIDWDASSGDTIFYTNPPTPSPAYTPGPPPDFIPFRVSVRTMENNLKDSSVQNFYFGLERQFFSNVLFRVNYQGSFGRHLPVLMNWNRYDGMAYTPTLSYGTRPNTHYTGFNYRSNNVTSNYDALVVEVQKRLSNGLQIQGGYTWGHLLDFGSDLFSGETATGGYSQPYYFVSNNHKNLEYASGAFDHKHGLKLNFSYELPFLKSQQGLVGKVAGGWQISGFYQGYSGHPLEVYNARIRYRGNALDPNGNRENIGGDYNLDRVFTDHPDFVGSSIQSSYSNKSPADGIFTDNNPIGCGFAGQLSTNTQACNDANGVVTPNTLFVNPPGFGVRFGRLGRNVFRGPWFNGFDAGIFKNVNISERWKLQIRFEGLNVANHPSFDGIITNLNAGDFGRAHYLVGSAPVRRIQLGARLTF